MNQYTEAQTKRLEAATHVRSAIIALASAGVCLLAGREGYPPEAQELATALRDDITRMVGDVETLLSVVSGRN